MKKVWSISLVLAFTHANVARAQGLVRLSPLFGISQVYDSNLFFTPADRQADFVTRMTPGLESEYRSALMALVGRYTRDIEHYADHRDLTSMNAREHASVESTYRATRRLTLVAGAELSKTQTPGELSGETTGLTFTRAAARRVTAHSSVTRQLGRLTDGRMEYTFTEDQVAGGIGVRNHLAAVGTHHQLTPRDTVTAGYRVDQIRFETDGVPVASTTTHALSVGWTRAVTHQARLSIEAGPYVTNGSPTAEVSASIGYRIRSVDLSLGYSRRQNTIIGLAGIARTESMTGSAAWNLLRHSLQVQVSPAFFQSVHPMVRADVYRLAIDVDHRIANGLSVGFAVNMNRQRTVGATLTRDNIARQTAMIRLVAAPVARH
ncbi:MAG TPA: hypothetical protein VGJ39_09380 [Vicinamibacterales bacterium]